MEDILLALIAPLMTLIGGYLVGNLLIKKAKKEVADYIFDLKDELIASLPQELQKDDVKKAFYTIGILIGNGARQGIGVESVGKGSKGLMGLVEQFAPAILGRFMGGANAPPSQPTGTGGIPNL